MRIFVDMDEVMVQFVKKVLDRWNSEFGTLFTKDQINTFSMEDVLRPIHPGLIDEWCGEKGFFLDMEPYPGAVEGFNRLTTAGHEVYIATSILKNADHCYDDKRAWVRRYFPDFSMKNFIAVSRKGVLDGDMLIDDGGHNITDWHNAGRYQAVIVDRPWNQGLFLEINDPFVVRRVSGLDEISRVITGDR